MTLKGNFLIFNIFISWDRNRASSFGKEIPVELVKRERGLLGLPGLPVCSAFLQGTRRGLELLDWSVFAGALSSGRRGRVGALENTAGQEKLPALQSCPAPSFTAIITVARTMEELIIAPCHTHCRIWSCSVFIASG